MTEENKEFTPVPTEEGNKIDNLLGLKMISIRLEENLIQDFKNLAELKGIKYQVLMRNALIDFVAKSNSQIVADLVKEIKDKKKVEVETIPKIKEIFDFFTNAGFLNDSLKEKVSLDVYKVLTNQKSRDEVMRSEQFYHSNEHTPRGMFNLALDHFIDKQPVNVNKIHSAFKQKYPGLYIKGFNVDLLKISEFVYKVYTKELTKDIVIQYCLTRDIDKELFEIGLTFIKS